MPKEKIPFEAFLNSTQNSDKEFVSTLHTYLLGHGCSFEIKEAKAGFLVSYIYLPAKRTVANYVFRKKGLFMRVYADNIRGYMEILDAWPDTMKKSVEKAGPCKRMLDPAACNSRCLMGFDFDMDGKRRQKCRNSAFLLLLDEESKPYIKEMIECEISTRIKQQATL